jgi:predicted nucleic acid-binding protein
MTWLIDKSALVRLSASPDAAEWADRIGRGLVHITTVTLLEVGRSARSARSARDLRTASSRPPLSLMPVEYLTPAMEQRAVDVQLQLADRGLHRAPGIPDLLIAVAAERAGHVLLHLDKDFELIADLTGQANERLRIL